MIRYVEDDAGIRDIALYTLRSAGPSDGKEHCRKAEELPQEETCKTA